jgi:hypothetical protein
MEGLGGTWKRTGLETGRSGAPHNKVRTEVSDAPGGGYIEKCLRCLGWRASDKQDAAGLIGDLNTLPRQRHEHQTFANWRVRLLARNEPLKRLH